MEYVLGGVVIGAIVGFVGFRLMKRATGPSRSEVPDSPTQGEGAQPDEEEGPPLSMVALMTELPFLDVDVLKRALETDFGVDFDAADDQPSEPDEESETPLELRFADGDNFVMDTPMGTYMVRVEGHMHGVIAHEDPYFDDIEQAAESVNDLRSKQALHEHRCWMAVDHVGDLPDNAKLHETYARLGKLLLSIIDPTLCTAVLLPRAQKFFPWRDGMEEALASGDVLGDLSETAHVPVTGVDGEDPEMKAAVATAHERWPEFVDAFQNSRGEAFGVKFLLPGDEEDAFEFPWLEVTAIHDEIIQGNLANEPIGRADLHEGSKVTTRLADMNDWLYLDEQGEQQGGFTIPILMRGMQGGD